MDLFRYKTYRAAMDPLGEEDDLLYFPGRPERLAGYRPVLDRQGNPINAIEYLKQELGINLEKNKNRSLSTAISKPQDFIYKREEAIDKAADTSGEAFSKYLLRLLDVGVPYKKANETAKLYAKTVYDAEMSVYDMGNPGYSTAIGSQVVERTQKEGIRDLFLDKEAKRAYKKKWEKKYKAKQALK